MTGEWIVLAGPVAILVGHFLLTGRYFEPCPVPTHHYKIFGYATWHLWSFQGLSFPGDGEPGREARFRFALTRWPNVKCTSGYQQVAMPTNLTFYKLQIRGRRKSGIRSSPSDFLSEPFTWSLFNLLNKDYVFQSRLELSHKMWWPLRNVQLMADCLVSSCCFSFFNNVRCFIFL